MLGPDFCPDSGFPLFRPRISARIPDFRRPSGNHAGGRTLCQHLHLFPHGMMPQMNRMAPAPSDHRRPLPRLRMMPRTKQRAPDLRCSRHPLPSLRCGQATYQGAAAECCLQTRHPRIRIFEVNMPLPDRSQRVRGPAPDHAGGLSNVEFDAPFIDRELRRRP